jgi:hypothetical protein
MACASRVGDNMSYVFCCLPLSLPAFIDPIRGYGHSRCDIVKEMAGGAEGRTHPRPLGLKSWL